MIDVYGVRDLSKQSGINVFTISGFENGIQKGISLSSIIKLIFGSKRIMPGMQYDCI
jgi:hypothetical protein